MGEAFGRTDERKCLDGQRRGRPEVGRRPTVGWPRRRRIPSCLVSIMPRARRPSGRRARGFPTCGRPNHQQQEALLTPSRRLESPQSGLRIGLTSMCYRIFRLDTADGYGNHARNQHCIHHRNQPRPTSAGNVRIPASADDGRTASDGLSITCQSGTSPSNVRTSHAVPPPTTVIPVGNPARLRACS